MADDIINVRASSAFDDPNRMGGVAAVKPRRTRASALDGEEMRTLRNKLLSWMQAERDRQSLNRYNMAIDEDYFDGFQWDHEDAVELAERGQAPLVFNKIKPAIEWLLGTQKRTRVDYKILPREESDEKPAEVKTKLLKYVDDANNYQFAESDSFQDAVVAGLGWLEEGINVDAGSELAYVGTESWRNVLHDSFGTNRDINIDGRYLFRWRWFDLDVAQAMFPTRKTALASAALEADEIAEKDEDIWYLGARTNSEQEDYISPSHSRVVRTGSPSEGPSSRQRVKIIEGWYKRPVSAQVMRGSGVYDGEIFNAADEGHAAAVRDGVVTLATTMHMEMRLMVMTESATLWEGQSPYRHNRFPLTPIWCYRRKRDNMPYGKIRDIRDAQDDLNKRASKALFILSTNQIVMDSEAVDAKDIEDLRAEAARPDGILVKRKGTELTLKQDKQLAEEHLMLMDRDAKMIQDVSGVTDENMGRKTNATSGIAIERRQDQGSTVSVNVFDNLRFAKQISGSKRLALLEQFYTANRVVRIVGENKPVEWIPINAVDPDTGEPVNVITASKCDYIIGEQDWRASLRSSMFAEMMDMLGKIAPVMPQAAMNLLDLVVEMSDVPNRDEMVARIRKINGQGDPSRKPTPQEEQARQKAEAMAAETAMLQMDRLRGEVEKLKATGGHITAQTFGSIVDGLLKSLQAAQIVATVPGVTPVADVIAQSSGFKDAAGQDPNIPPAQIAAPVAQPVAGIQQPGAASPGQGVM